MIWLAGILLGFLSCLTVLLIASKLHTSTPQTIESEDTMSEPEKVEQVGLNEYLGALHDSNEAGIQDVLDLNRDIMLATRKMAHNILKIRQGHIEEAERLYKIANDLIESAVVTATIAADMIDVEFGGELPDFDRILGGEDDDEDEDDE